NRYVAFRRQPSRSATRARRQIALANQSWGRRAAVRCDWIVRRPTSLVREAFFISDPANIGANVAEDARRRLQRSHQLPRSRPIVIPALVDRALPSRAAVESVATVRAVVPDLEDIAVVRQQLAQLRTIHRDVLRTSVQRAVAIPRR